MRKSEKSDPLAQYSRIRSVFGAGPPDNLKSQIRKSLSRLGWGGGTSERLGPDGTIISILYIHNYDIFFCRKFHQVESMLCSIGKEEVKSSWK